MLSQKAKYAFKALIYLAQQEHGHIAKTSEIAETEQIPKKFLELILLDLKRAKILSSKQGVNGGYYMLKNPALVTIAEIYRLFDGAIALLPCISNNYYEPCLDCKEEKICELRWGMEEVKKQTLLAMENITIQMMIDSKKTHLIS